MEEDFGNGAVGGFWNGPRVEEEALTELWGKTIKLTEPEEEDGWSLAPRRLHLWWILLHSSATAQLTAALQLHHTGCKNSTDQGMKTTEKYVFVPFGFYLFHFLASAATCCSDWAGLSLLSKKYCEARAANVGHQLTAGLSACSQRCTSPLCCQLIPHFSLSWASSWLLLLLWGLI